jgi:hypothetical protein
MNTIKQPILNKKECLELPHEVLVDLMKTVFTRGGQFKFRAKGASMSPFIRDGDVLTLVPCEGRDPVVGRVIACFNPQTQKLIVHRIVAAKVGSYLIKGDNSLTQTDGWISREQIIGAVARVERMGRQVRLGLGIEGWLIAYLSKIGLLTRIISRLRWVIQ